jgi:hypothetical protein
MQKPKQQGEITITCLPDGSIKIETDKVADAAHVRAERFIGEIQRLLGGAVQRTKRGHGHHHHAHEDHDHDHDHGGEHAHE